MDDTAEELLKNQIRCFLKEFKFLMDENQFIVRKHQKNRDGLVRLGLNYLQLYNVIRSLRIYDYYAGPKIDTLHPGEYWEFGKTINNIEVYIKIKVDYTHDKAYCYSFHPAEFPIRYPLKK